MVESNADTLLKSKATQQSNETEANPYNSKKDYMDGKEDKPFVSSNSLFFDETSSETSNVEEMSVEEEVQSEDKPYQRPDYKNDMMI